MLRHIQAGPVGKFRQVDAGQRILPKTLTLDHSSATQINGTSPGPHLHAKTTRFWQVRGAVSPDLMPSFPFLEANFPVPHTLPSTFMAAVLGSP